jgi:hypothetical protein
MTDCTSSRDTCCRYIRSSDVFVVLVEHVGVCVGKLPVSATTSNVNVMYVAMRIIENTTDVTCVSCGEVGSSSSAALGHSSGALSLFVPFCGSINPHHSHLLLPKQSIASKTLHHSPSLSVSSLSSSSSISCGPACGDAIITLRDPGSDHRRGCVSSIAYDT